MARNDNKLLALVAWSCTGDLGPWSFYTSRRRKIVFYPRSPALSPASPIQTVIRDRWRMATQAWKAMDRTLQSNWETATRALSLGLNGYALHVYWYTTGDTRSLQSIQRMSGIDLGF
jgi:hypothetical protein